MSSAQDRVRAAYLAAEFGVNKAQVYEYARLAGVRAGHPRGYTPAQADVLRAFVAARRAQRAGPSSRRYGERGYAAAEADTIPAADIAPHRRMGGRRVGALLGLSNQQVLNRARNLGIAIRRGFSADEVAAIRDYRPRSSAPKVPPRGERNPRHKLTEDDVREIRRRLARGDKQATLAQFYGISLSHLKAIRARQTWAHLDAPGAPPDPPA